MGKSVVMTDVSVQLKRLQQEHAELEMRLSELQRHLSLSPAEQREYHQLKKTKLRLRDNILHYQRLH